MGLYLSFDQGQTWTNCPTNSFSSQRQDITGLELTNMGGGVTRILAAVGMRGFPTYVQYDLGINGANGIYSANMPDQWLPRLYAPLRATPTDLFLALRLPAARTSRAH